MQIVLSAVHQRIDDRTIEAWNFPGDLPLAERHHDARTLRIADGPDEVHRILIAKNIFAHYRDGEGWDFGN